MTKEIIRYISPEIRKYLEETDEAIWEKAEEIHLSVGKPAMIYYNGGIVTVKASGVAVMCSKKIINDTMLLLTDNSLYSVNDKICNGYITVRGGNRVGIVGTAVLKDGRISTIRDISSINIRLSREVVGAAEKLKQTIIVNNSIQNTLIISPPKCGKTTLLRDIARLLGNGDMEISPYKVSIIDERGEIAAVYNGVCQNDVGLCTDILDACPKCKGIPYVVRSMSPDVIITDELGGTDDCDAIRYALSCGVKVITSVHGNSFEDLQRKDGVSELITAFDVLVFLTNMGGTGTIKEVVRRENVAV